MATIERASGILLETESDVQIRELQPPAESAPVGGTRARRAIELPSGPVPLGPASPEPAVDPVAASMTEQDLILVDSFEMTPAPARRRRAAPAPSRMSVDIPEEEDAAVLLEQDGMYSWQFPTSSRSVPPQRTRRGPLVEAPHKRVTFTLPITGEAAPRRRRSLGPVAEFVLDKVRVYVFRFVARVGARATVKFLERNAKPGIVVMDSNDPTVWRRIEDLSQLALPTDRAARILLFVHGTFSTTVGSYGALGCSDWGRAFLKTARQRYDVIIGYDHPTLSVTPLENATDLLARLESATLSAPPHIDAVAYSRGALVLRSLIEYLLPRSRLGCQVRRAVFVGGTNGGTQLASAKNWARLIDLWTNLAAATCRALSALGPVSLATTILNQAIATLGALVKYLATAAVEDDAVPGLAAMRPDGPFVREINQAQPGQPSAVASHYCVIASDFDLRLFEKGQGANELPKRFVKWALDALSDALMKESNDLVVHTRAMSEIDTDLGVFVKDRLDFGGNTHVYHTVYFTRPEVSEALTRWLEPQMLAAPMRPTAPVAALPSLAELAGKRAAARNVRVHVPVDTESASDEDLLADLESTGEHAIEDLKAALESIDSESAPDEDFRVDLEATGTTAMPEALPADAEPAEESVLAEARELAETRRRVRRAPPPVAPARPPSIAPGGAPPVPPAAAPNIRDEARPKSEPATWNVAASMPEVVPLHKTVMLDVTLSREEIQMAVRAAAARAAVKIDERKALVIHVVPKKNLDVLDTDLFELDVSTGPLHQLAFRVRGTDPGPAEVWVRVMQGPLVLTSLSLQPKVAPHVPKKVKHVRAGDFACEPAAPVARYPVLQIFEQVTGSGLSFRFTLDMGDGSFPLGSSRPMKVKRDKYVAELYKEIEDRWTGSNGDRQAFERELRTYGGILYDNLVPPEVQVPLWNARDTLKAIQVVSEEPFIPWEIVHLKPPQQPGGGPSRLPAEEHFLANKGMVRWLHNRGQAPASVRVRKERAFYIVPKYPQQFDLPAAQAEIPFLTSELKAAPLKGDSNAILGRLQDAGSIDLLHFAGHGATDATKVSDARLMLQGRTQANLYIPDYLKASDVQQHVSFHGTNGSRPLVFLNACQSGRLGWYLTEMGGFAEAFLRAGVGIFVGTLWEVGDLEAKQFGKAFYGALKSGQSLAQATITARKTAREQGEPTWLAYAVYGYPNARVTYE